MKVTCLGEIYKGYEIRWVKNENRPIKWLPTIIHPTERSRSMTARTVAGCKRIIDAIHAKTNRVNF